MPVYLKNLQDETGVIRILPGTETPYDYSLNPGKICKLNIAHQFLQQNFDFCR